MSEWKRSRDHVSAIQSEAIGGCQLGKWSSLIHIMALSTVICRSIFTIYPNCIRPLVHGLVKSCIDLSDTFPDEECFNILWSRHGGLEFQRISWLFGAFRRKFARNEISAIFRRIFTTPIVSTPRIFERKFAARGTLPRIFEQ